MSVEEYESLGARFFGLIFKDATVYPAVRKKAAELGLPCVMLSEYQQAEAKEAGLVDAAMALCAERMAEPFRAPIVLMSSGENVVTVGAESGVGGRNQEYCTAAAVTIAGSPEDRLRCGRHRRHGRPRRLPVPRRAGLPRRCDHRRRNGAGREAGRDRSGGRAAHARHVGAALAARLRRGGGSKCLRARSARDFDSGIKEIQKE